MKAHVNLKPKHALKVGSTYCSLSNVAASPLGILRQLNPAIANTFAAQVVAHEAMLNPAAPAQGIAATLGAPAQSLVAQVAAHEAVLNPPAPAQGIAATFGAIQAAVAAIQVAVAAASLPEIQAAVVALQAAVAPIPAMQAAVAATQAAVAAIQATLVATQAAVAALPTRADHMRLVCMNTIEFSLFRFADSMRIENCVATMPWIHFSFSR